MDPRMLAAARSRFPDLHERLEQTEAMLEVERDEVLSTGHPAHPRATRSSWQPTRQVAAIDRAIHELDLALRRLAR